MSTFDIDNPAPTPEPNREIVNASLFEHASYLEDLAQPGGALWHSPLDRARLMFIARRLWDLASSTS